MGVMANVDFIMVRPLGQGFWRDYLSVMFYFVLCQCFVNNYSYSLVIIM